MVEICTKFEGSILRPWPQGPKGQSTDDAKIINNRKFMIAKNKTVDFVKKFLYLFNLYSVDAKFSI